MACRNTYLVNRCNCNNVIGMFLNVSLVREHIYNKNALKLLIRCKAKKAYTKDNH